MLKDIGIDGTDGSGKDEVIKFLCQKGFLEQKCGGVGIDENGYKRFDISFLIKQYRELKGFMQGRHGIAVNRTFFSFIAGEILDGRISPDAIDQRFSVLQEIGCFNNSHHIIVERSADVIIETLTRRARLSLHERRLLESRGLLVEQQEVFREIGEKVGATIVNNDKNIIMLRSKIDSLFFSKTS